jgi:hypothetical protein
MNPPPTSLPPEPSPATTPRSSFRRVLMGILVGIAPLPIALLAIAGASKSSQVDGVILALFFGAAICSVAGGTLVGMCTTAKLGARIALGLLIALGFFAVDVTGGIFFGCLIVMGKGI